MCLLLPVPTVRSQPRSSDRVLFFLHGASAVTQIRELRPDLSTVVTVREGSMVTQDVRRDRVRVFVDGDGVVSRTPRVG